MSETKQAMLVIYESPNGRDQWKPLTPQEVPAWVRAPDVMAKLVKGDMAMDCKIESPWYRADLVDAAGNPDLERIAAARAKRLRRAEKRVAEAHRTAERSRLMRRMH